METEVREFLITDCIDVGVCVRDLCNEGYGYIIEGSILPNARVGQRVVLNCIKKPHVYPVDVIGILYPTNISWKECGF